MSQEHGHLTIVPSTVRDLALWVRSASSSINGLIRGGPFLRVWKKSAIGLESAKVDATQPPTWSAFRNGVHGYSFSASATNEVWASLHIGHDFSRGSLVYPHVHWATTADATGVVRWGIEHTVARGHGQDLFPTATSIYMERTGATAYAHNVAEAATASAIDSASVALEPDSILLMRVFRDGAHANDTMTAPAFGFAVGIHYQADARGTPQKAPDFYT